jgi:16S rRNA (adenine1518-N6/adenine1519-N6)-dimethyltransferase
LTQHLKKKYQDLLAIEIDRRLTEIHQNQGYGFISQDFLEWDFRWADQELKSFSVISNLPYDVGTKILERLVIEQARVPHFVVMLQKEVAERVAAKPRTKSFGSLSVLVQGAYEIELLGTLPPGAFSPPPKVYSSVIRGFRRVTAVVPQTEAFRAFVKRAFLHKRKTISNALRAFLDRDQVVSALLSAQILPTARAEELDLSDWNRLYSQLSEAMKSGE